MKRFVTHLSIMLVSCGHHACNPEMPPEAQSIYDSFMEEARKHEGPLLDETVPALRFIQFVDFHKKSDNYGGCYVGYYTSRKALAFSWIKINNRFWKNLSHCGKRVVLYHELAHCTLGIGHEEVAAPLPDLMSPYFIDDASCQQKIDSFWASIKMGKYTTEKIFIAR